MSNGRHFNEVYCHLQPQFVQAELFSPSPASLACQPSVDNQKVEPPAEPTAPTQENRDASHSRKPSPQCSRQPSGAPSRRTTPIVRTPPRSPSRSPPRSPSAPSVALDRTSTASLTDAQAKQIMKAWIETSLWLHQDEKEPVVGAPGVPTCALQLAEKGQSIYCCFLIAEKDRKGKILGYKCASDPNSVRDRLHRAIGRERVRYGHRPFRCPRHHDRNWYDISFVNRIRHP
jgi:hypothetical protein